MDTDKSVDMKTGYFLYWICARSIAPPNAEYNGISIQKMRLRIGGYYMLFSYG